MLDYDFKIRIMCLLLLSFVGKSVGGVCPPPGEISPCICGDLGSEGLVVQLSCQGTNLDDSRASQILEKMLYVVYCMKCIRSMFHVYKLCLVKL